LFPFKRRVTRASKLAGIAIFFAIIEKGDYYAALAAAKCLGTYKQCM